MSARTAGGRRRPGPDRSAAWRFSLFAVVTAALALFMAFRIVGTDLGSHYRLHARFDNVNGLRQGDLVKVAGTPVGRVAGVKVDKGAAVVTMTVRRAVKLPDDSAAVVRWRDLIGEREVMLEPGTSPRSLTAGQTMTRTRSAVDLGALINDLGPLIGGIDPADVNKILQAFAVALDGNGDDVGQITANLASLLKVMGTQTGTIQQMVADYKTITDALAARDRQIGATIDNITTLTAAFATNSDVVDDGIVQLSDLMARLNKVIGPSSADLAALLDSSADLMEITHQHIGVIEKLIKGMPTALQAMLSILNGGHFVRANALCINIVYTDTCPFPWNLPPPPAAGSGGGAAKPAELTSAQQQTFVSMMKLMLLGSEVRKP
ncbi:MCE family protein [Actinocorallia sp. A-T 12471]|uniref:MCE family protein n=1 Tax=Actinocorallia sp. A-T 12471 TaxID=3089813 RepID=UPI0029CEA734|nr:MCE family protein [Actinocorallia sp. A-T 12471]MDX6741477.1 MCE family protein [Actinocorallia sp. A-T 12471]